jgi:hypothetical protein
MSFWDTSNAISSQGLADGPMPLNSQDGPKINQFGPDHVLASLSAKQAKDLRLLTSGTYGRPSTTLSHSAALQSSLENKLQARLSMLGSTLYTLTWKDWVTPSGVYRSRLRASVRRISAIERTGQQVGWTTPTTRDHKDTPGMVAQRDGRDRVDQLPRQAYLCGWPTPVVRDYRNSGGDG